MKTMIQINNDHDFICRPIDDSSLFQNNENTTSKSNKRSKRKNVGPERLLPADFEPSAYSVIIGRGKKIRETTGNCRLRVIASSFLPRYAENKNNKAMKTILVDKVVDLIKTACKESDCNCRGLRCRRMAFVRQSKDGRWFMVDDGVAREKVGYAFRDLLADSYESSSKSKIAKKMQKKRRQEEQEQEQCERQRLQQRQHYIIKYEVSETNIFDTAAPIAQEVKQQEEYINVRSMSPVLGSTGNTFEDALLNSPLIECTEDGDYFLF